MKEEKKCCGGGGGGGASCETSTGGWEEVGVLVGGEVVGVEVQVMCPLPAPSPRAVL